MKRLALVTGAAAGLARGVAFALARDGFRIAFSYRPGGTLPDETLALVRPHDPEALAIAADLTLTGASAALCAQVHRVRGPIDVLVHAMGPMVIRRFAASTLDDYRAMIEGNLTSAVELAYAVIPPMRERGFGRLVFFGMNGSHATLPARGLAFYAAAKAGVVAFARTLAIEEAVAGITVNVVEPGDIRDKAVDRITAAGRSAANPTGHPGTWEDIADAVGLVVRNDAGYLNGMVLGVNGGLVEAHEPMTAGSR